MQKLIIIDDDPFFHFIIEKIMNRHTDNTTVTYSYDGMSVINHLKENLGDESMLPDYIFVDLNMPLFNGFDFVKLYEELSSSIYKTIKIYIVSSSINPRIIREVLNYPFISNYITKPMTKKILEGILNIS
ncbi:response regulator [Mucilaginibacter glaciei]|uniref:Response regulator n=1 Tax=Mucilaginibacter glaciei TaxID=2772109 RepID=A0A926NTC8_9SPHI|nr:response regulator [Mucilaginibacter glaciei]MBD1394652.1 response regulator [Mucilaginibacter glaciei]